MQLFKIDRALYEEIVMAYLVRLEPLLQGNLKLKSRLSRMSDDQLVGVFDKLIDVAELPSGMDLPSGD
jgi:hypothetical protein